MAAAETASDPGCASGYFWYICAWTTPSYSGCCNVDPCREEPVGCPASATGESAPDETVVTITSYVYSSTVTITKTAQHQSSDSSSSSSAPSPSLTTSSSFTSSPSPSLFSSSAPPPTPGAGAPTSPTISSTQTTDIDTSKGNGLTISVSALIGIVLACSVITILAALSACMWWGRRRRQKNEKAEKAERAIHSAGIDEELVPPGLESVFNPMAQSGPGSVFDRAEGRMAEGSNVLGFSPMAHDPRFSNRSSVAHSSLISPLTTGSSYGSGMPLSPSELDSTPVRGDAAVLRQDAAELESHPAPKGEVDGRPRATLNSTQQEREAGTYANSWAKFQNVQL